MPYRTSKRRRYYPGMPVEGFVRQLKKTGETGPFWIADPTIYRRLVKHYSGILELRGRKIWKRTLGIDKEWEGKEVQAIATSDGSIIVLTLQGQVLQLY
jgi:hypothetical protein